MNIVKRALINLIRMPVRNLLCFLVVLITVFTITVCGNLYAAGGSAKQALDDEYPVIATVIPKGEISPEGVKISFLKLLTLDELAILQKSDTVNAYNMRLMGGTLAEEEILKTLPDNQILSSTPAPTITKNAYQIFAVNNVMMEQSFVNGDYRMIAGACFDDADVHYGAGNIIISKWVADTYEINVGDRIVCKAANGNSYRYRTVKGIYEAINGDAVTVSYITIADLFADWANFTGGMSKADRPQSDGNVYRTNDSVTRLDFHLKDAASAAIFISDAKRNGFDLDSFEIIVNDKAYKTADAGIGQIVRISLFLSLLSLVSGVVIIAAITAYHRSTRVREAMILRCLGMESWKITAMFTTEMVIVLLSGVMIGFFGGQLASDGVINLISREYLAETQQKANERAAVKTSYAEQGTTTIYYPLTVRFGENVPEHFISEQFVPSNANAPSDTECGIRLEPFFICGGNDDKKLGKSVTVVGRTDRSDNMENPTDEILYPMTVIVEKMRV